jgi:hypothetical protein
MVAAGRKSDFGELRELRRRQAGEGVRGRISGGRFCVFAAAPPGARFRTMRVNSFPAGTYEQFSGVTLEEVHALAFCGVSPWHIRDFPVCRSWCQCKEGERGRMEKRETRERREGRAEKKVDGLLLPLFLKCFPFSPFPLFPSYTDVYFVDRSGPQRALFGQHRQGTTFATGLPSSLAANNLTKRN